MAILKDLIVQGPSRFIGEAKGTKFVTDGGTSSLFVKGDGTLDSTEYVAVTKGTKTYTGVIGTADNNPGAVFYFLSVKPKDWNAPCVIKYRISASMAGQVQGTAQSVMSLCFCRNTVPSYDVWNYIGNTSYRPYYYHYRYLATLTGYNAGYGHLVGIGLNASYASTNSTYARTFVVDVLEAENCDFTFLSSMTKYASVPGTGSTNFSGESTFDATTVGETHTGDRNTTNSISLTGGLGPAGSLGIFPYALIMQENNGSWSPIVTSYSTGTTKTVNPAGFKTDFIFYYYNSSTAAANAVNITGLYLVTTLDFRYSANCGTTLTNSRPIYLVGTFNPDDGLFYLDSTTWWSQEVDPNGNPTRYIDNNGEVKYIHKAYILLGQTYSTYQIQLYPDHPIYYGYNGEVKLWSKEAEKEKRDYSKDYLTLIALESGQFLWNGAPISYSINNGDWSTESEDNEVLVEVIKGDTVRWKIKIPEEVNIEELEANFGRFSSNILFNVCGNIGSLIYNDDFVELDLPYVTPTAFLGLFENTQVIDAQNFILPATTLANSCYKEMFFCCTSLTTPPELPATTLAAYCYLSMFVGCTSLITAPSLPATTLANYCYNGMFWGCTSLTKAPELPATTLANNYCYSGMFLGCTSLEKAPELPATTLTAYCYLSMFLGCTSLKETPKLVLNTLGESSCDAMFGLCTGLEKGYLCPYDENNGFTLADSCFAYMFLGCTSLLLKYSSSFSEGDTEYNTIRLYSANMAEGCYSGMFSGCINLGCFPSLSITSTTSTSYRCCYEMFRNCGITMELSYYENPIYFGTQVFDDECFAYMFAGCTISSATYINPLSNNTTSIGYGSFEGMFLDCKQLTLVPLFTIANITLGNSCFSFMFAGCTSLLNLTNFSISNYTLANSCYAYMFSGCTSLMETPSLPSITLVSYCYKGMFLGCTSLTTPPQLPATTLATGCYDSMFDGCTHLRIAPELPAVNHASRCYAYMFLNCKSLIEVPNIQTISAASDSHDCMFKGCDCLKFIRNLLKTVTNTSGSHGASNAPIDLWLTGVSSIGIYVKPDEGVTWTNINIPTGWTVYTESEWNAIKGNKVENSISLIKTINGLSLVGTGDIEVLSLLDKVDHGTSDTTFALIPNQMHIWGSVSSLTLTLATPSKPNKVNEYLFSFTSPATPTTLSLPATIDWAIDLDIEANKTYHISIIDNLATYLTADMVVSGADSGALYATKAYVDEMIGDLEQQLTNL